MDDWFMKLFPASDSHLAWIAILLNWPKR